MAVEPRYTYDRSLVYSEQWCVFDGGTGQIIAECPTEEAAQQIVVALNSTDKG